eukprot:CAMPEP_0175156592 /NCGR_PEP_ID=MMETSP0087-20121206/21691_1 /TAXON_ID=136419 /ORGANISM="Unknown Unknown, Strain D1" /LENGTH=88 /DNA_ID=CAMNT_0016444025 /DNA_START=156 /DNA_END=423 /DNA_ORIENTATION=+
MIFRFDGNLLTSATASDPYMSAALTTFKVGPALIATCEVAVGVELWKWRETSVRPTSSPGSYFLSGREEPPPICLHWKYANYLFIRAQ